MKKISKKSKIIIAITILLIIPIPFIVSQVVQTQVIELTEKVRDFFVEATKGNIVGQATLNKFGENLVVGIAEEDIQSQGGTLIFLQSAEIITISSSSANDDLNGTNATSVEITGLDENFTEISEIVNLSGVTEVNTTKEYIRAWRMKVNEVGNYSTTNAGTITGTASITGSVQIEIPAGEGQSQTTHYTVPAGQNIIIVRVAATVNTGKEVDIKLRVRENADDFIRPYAPIKTLRGVRGISVPVSGILRGNLRFGEKTDIWVTGITTAGTTASIEANYDLVQYATGT